MKQLWKRYNAFLRQTPEVTVAWADPKSDARAWLVVNSFRGGAAGGGTRMHRGVNPREVIYLAKAMELKFALSGPPIGGAKCGIDFDNEHPDKAGVLLRWYDAILPYLHDRYGTAGDLGIDEFVDVAPALHKLGLRNSQEGIVRGHLHPEPEQLTTILRRLDEGGAAPADGSYGVAGMSLNVADMITGYGVATAIRRYYESLGRGLQGVRVQLEGFGNVGASCAVYLTRAGARIVAISDHEKTLIDERGLGEEEITDLLARRENRALPGDDSRLFRGKDRARIWSTPADVFVAAAVSATVTESVVNRLVAAGVTVMACGANQPFDEVKLGSTRIAQYADRRFAVLADILANCGRARTFSYLMGEDAQPNARGVFGAVDRTITETLRESLERNGSQRTGLLAGTVGYALDLIGAA